MATSYFNSILPLLFCLTLYRASAGTASEHQTTNEAPLAQMVSVQPPRLAKQAGHTNIQDTTRKHAMDLGRVSGTDHAGRQGINQDGLLERQNENNGIMQEKSLRQTLVGLATTHSGRGFFVRNRDLNDRYLAEADHHRKTLIRGTSIEKVLHRNKVNGEQLIEEKDTDSTFFYSFPKQKLNVLPVHEDIQAAKLLNHLFLETKGQLLLSVPRINRTVSETGHQFVNSTQRVYKGIGQRNTSAIIEGGTNRSGSDDSNSMNASFSRECLKMEGSQQADVEMTNKIISESKKKLPLRERSQILKSDDHRLWEKRSAMNPSKKQDVKPYSITAEYINLFTHKNAGIERPAVRSMERKDIFRKLLSSEMRGTVFHESSPGDTNIDTVKTNDSKIDLDKSKVSTINSLVTDTSETNSSESDEIVKKKTNFSTSIFESDTTNKQKTNTTFRKNLISNETNPEHSISGNEGYGTYKISNDSTISHLDLDRLEAELSLKENSQHDLLFAISILQHHSLPGITTPKSDISSRQTEESLEIDDLKQELMHSNEVSVELDNELSQIHQIFPDKLNLVNLNQNGHSKPSSVTLDARSYESNLPNTMFIDGELNTDEGDHRSGSSSPDQKKHFPIDTAYSTSDIGFLPHDMLLDELGQHVPGGQEFGRKSTLGAGNEIRRNRPLITVSEPIPEKNIKWFILVMDGDCGIISKRMNTFVMFLKAALSSRLDAQYDDILVMSVFCDSTFMVNISLDTSRYTNALSQLQALADANTTLLEISGEIFYLEKIITQNSEGLLGRLGRSNDAEDVELLLYIAVGSVCAFILVSVCIVTVVSICRKEDTELTDIQIENVDKSEIPIRKPNVIYSHKFTQELNPEKYRLTPFEESSHEGVSPSVSANFDSAKGYSSERGNNQSSSTDRCHDRKSHLNPSASKIQLLEEVQEEDEDEIEDFGVLEGDEDYHDEEDDVEEIDDEDDDFFIENMTRPLQESHLQHHQGHSTGRVNPITSTHHRMDCCHNARSCKTPSSTLPTNFDNPCYDR